MIAIPPALARRVLDSSPDAMVVIDAFGSIWFANRQVSALFDYANDELIGESIEKLMPEHFQAEQVNHRTHFARNMHVRPMGAEIELVGRRRDGKEFPLEVSLSPIDDAGRTLIAAAIRDVSDRRRAEAELTVARGAVAALRDLADRANDSGRRSLEAATQELRQPLETLMRVHRTLSHLVSDPEAAEALAQQEHALRALSRTLQALPSKS
jgi:protein-histidine pros-kinase